MHNTENTPPPLFQSMKSTVIGGFPTPELQYCKASTMAPPAPRPQVPVGSTPLLMIQQNYSSDLHLLRDVLPDYINVEPYFRLTSPASWSHFLCIYISAFCHV